jgi:cobalt-zinc-cadmium efflux system membrane fusion protein
MYRYRIVLALTLLAAMIGWSCSDSQEAADTNAEQDLGSGEQVEITETTALEDFGPGEQSDEILDWCAEHAVPESKCTLCNPGLTDHFKVANDWCAGHDLPESNCRLCNPEISFPQEEILRQRALESSDEGISVSLFFRPNATTCATDGALIQFASAKTADRAGVTCQSVHQADRESSFGAPAEVVFDEARANVVTSTVAALVSRWLVVPGQVVGEGDVLAILQSPEVAELESRLLTARAALNVQEKNVARHEKLKSRDLVSDSDFEHQAAQGEQARAEYIAARGLLQAAGLSQADVDDIVEHRRISNSFALRAPADGVMVERVARLGELLSAGQAFALVADPSAMWIEAQLTETQLREVEVGQALLFSSDGRGLDRVGARVTWVARYLDPHSRTGTVRAEVIDKQHQLRAGEFGRAHFVREHNELVSLVPKDAVQWEGCCNVVFVEEMVGRYRPRKVEVLGGSGPYYQVTGDVHPGDDVVVEGAFLMKTELKKTSLGAGCCGLELIG